jgi:hypothetical protein
MKDKLAMSTMTASNFIVFPSERRAADRFPILRDVHYKVLSKRGGPVAGGGTTVNISSTGVLFTTDRYLIPGLRLELSISWPAQLNDKCQLKLVACGRVVRCEAGLAAMEILQYEFRTRATPALAPYLLVKK